MRLNVSLPVSLIFVLVSISFGQNLEARIDEYIENAYRPFHNIPGLGLTVVKDDGSTVDIVKGYGLRNIEDALPVTSQTKFAIGSVSKSFTAVLVVKSLSERFPNLPNFGLDVPIRDLVPAYNFTLSDRFRTEETTFRDLLSHKTCLSPTSMTLGLGVYKNKQDLAYRQRYADEACPFRTNWVYNNGVIELAAEILAAMENTAFNDMLQNFFRDLNMTDTTVIVEEGDYDTLPNMSRGYYRENGMTKRHNPQLLNRISYFTGAGGILSTPNDMKIYMMFHLNDGRVGNRQIVSQEAIRLVRASSNIVAGGQGKLSPNDNYEVIHSYGLCVLNSIHDGWERLWHNGYFPPYFSFMSFYPALKLGIFISSNGPGLFTEYGHSLLHHEIFYLIMNGGAINTTVAPKMIMDTNKVSSQTPIAKSAHIPDKNPRVELKDVVGLWGNGLEGEFVVTATPNSTHENVFIAYGQWGLGTLTRQSDSVFLIRWTTDIIQDDFTYIGNPITELFLGFTGNDTAFAFQDPNYGVTYKKDLTLDKLPAQPWAPGSCGPDD